MRKTFLVVPFVLAASLAGVPRDAVAQSGEASGFVSGTQEELGSTPLADGRVARRLFFSVTVIGDDASNPFHLASQDCFVTYVFTPNGELVEGKGACDGISADGELWWLSIEVVDGVVHWENRGGTGKFAGLTASGQTTIEAEFSDGKFIGRFEGVYQRR